MGMNLLAISWPLESTRTSTREACTVVWYLFSYFLHCFWLDAIAHPSDLHPAYCSNWSGANCTEQKWRRIDFSFFWTARLEWGRGGGRWTICKLFFSPLLNWHVQVSPVALQNYVLKQSVLNQCPIMLLNQRALHISMAPLGRCFSGWVSVRGMNPEHSKWIQQ